jgi:hypothetical protein
MAYNAAGLPSPAEQAFIEARRQIGYVRNLGNRMTLLAVSYRARAILLQGRLNDAWMIVEEAADLAADFALPKAAGTFLIQGEILLQRNQVRSRPQLAYRVDQHRPAAGFPIVYARRQGAAHSGLLRAAQPERGALGN